MSSPPTPPHFTSPPFAQWNSSFESALDVHLKTLLEPGTALTQAVLYAVKTPGKRVRPRMVEEASQLVSLPPRPSQLLQFAVELIHTFSLIHDDLPALDNDDWRRGQPTVHKRFDEAQALLAGDVLFQLGFQTLLQAAPQVEMPFFIRGSQFFLESLGPRGLIGGQSLEFELAGRLNPEQVRRVQDQKTGALFQACILTPFYWMGIGEADPVFQDACQFAKAFGYAFQVVDDIQDAKQDQSDPTKNILSQVPLLEAKKSALAELAASRLSHHFSAASALMDLLRQ